MSQDTSIIITEQDWARLRSLGGHPLLKSELDNAVVVDSRSVSPDVVTMNSRVRFEDESSGEIRDITIVFPHNAQAADGRVSVLAPVGTALLGLSVGQSIAWPFPDGSTRTLRVVELLYQPEADKRAASTLNGKQVSNTHNERRIR